jgi:hypothetical protein
VVVPFMIASKRWVKCPGSSGSRSSISVCCMSFSCPRPLILCVGNSQSVSLASCYTLLNTLTSSADEFADP